MGEGKNRTDVPKFDRNENFVFLLCCVCAGATYVGEFKNNMRDGQGTYKTPEGHCYQGPEHLSV